MRMSENDIFDVGNFCVVFLFENVRTETSAVNKNMRASFYDKNISLKKIFLESISCSDEKNGKASVIGKFKLIAKFFRFYDGIL